MIGLQGRDSVGAFDLESRQTCRSCQEPNVLCVHYWFPKILGGDVKPGDKGIILKSPRAWIGITCGCYARFHRQIAHIDTRQKYNKVRT